jgi:hypothetical protein
MNRHRTNGPQMSERIAAKNTVFTATPSGSGLRGRSFHRRAFLSSTAGPRDLDQI